jgi:hypothetical protein
MHKTTAALWTTAVLSFALIAALRPHSSADAIRPKTPRSPVAWSQPEAALVSGYKQWQRVNPKPQRVVSSLAMLCRSLTPQETVLLASNPHKDKFVTVSVNSIGMPAMMHAKAPVFPQGTIIVKEKSATAGGPPELLTVMRKRETGYAPSDGDWQYLVLNGTATKVTAQGHLQTCQACHAQWRKTDYVSRQYLPDAAASALR